jgi:hypothetical protein
MSKCPKLVKFDIRKYVDERVRILLIRRGFDRYKWIDATYTATGSRPNGINNLNLLKDIKNGRLRSLNERREKTTIW